MRAGCFRDRPFSRGLGEPFHPPAQPSKIFRRQAVREYREITPGKIRASLDLKDREGGQGEFAGNPHITKPGMVGADFQLAVGQAAESGFRPRAGLRDQAGGEQERSGDLRREWRSGQPEGHAREQVKRGDHPTQAARGPDGENEG
jgi:hypothetical protein